jgi:hypothetical protein
VISGRARKCKPYTVPTIGMNEKSPTMTRRNKDQPTDHQHRPMPGDNRRILARYWRRLIFSGCLAFVCLVGWTIANGTPAVQWAVPSGLSGQKVGIRPCGRGFLRSDIPCYHIPADPKATMAQWVRTVPVESELPDTELAPGKSTMTASPCPPGIPCPDDVSRRAINTFRKLYLQKKALLC